MFSVIFIQCMFSMLSLGRIVVSDLLAVSLFMFYPDHFPVTGKSTDYYSVSELIPLGVCDNGNPVNVEGIESVLPELTFFTYPNWAHFSYTKNISYM